MQKVGNEVYTICGTQRVYKNKVIPHQNIALRDKVA